MWKKGFCRLGYPPCPSRGFLPSGISQTYHAAIRQRTSHHPVFYARPIPMNEELRPTPETNPYVPNTSLRPTGTWIPDVGGLPVKLMVLGVSVFLMGMYVLGLPPATNTHGFIEVVPFTEAVRAAINADWTAYYSSRTTAQLWLGLWFLPVCSLGLIGYLAAPRSLHGLALAFHGMFVGLIVSLLAVANPLFLLVMLMLPMALLDALIGRADGETWQDTIYLSAVSSWVLMWIILLGMAWRRNRILARVKAAETKH